MIDDVAQKIQTIIQTQMFSTSFLTMHIFIYVRDNSVCSVQSVARKNHLSIATTVYKHDFTFRRQRIYHIHKSV